MASSVTAHENVSVHPILIISTFTKKREWEDVTQFVKSSDLGRSRCDTGLFLKWASRVISGLIYKILHFAITELVRPPSSCCLKEAFHPINVYL